jgi:hypothetical protein
MQRTSRGDRTQIVARSFLTFLRMRRRAAGAVRDPADAVRARAYRAAGAAVATAGCSPNSIAITSSRIRAPSSAASDVSA